MRSIFKICFIAFLAIRGIEGQSWKSVDLKVEADVVAYDPRTTSDKWIVGVQSQPLILRVTRLIKGTETSRYIAVHYGYGGDDQPLASEYLEKRKARKFSLHRIAQCTVGLSHLLWMSDVDAATGETIGKTPWLTQVTTELDQLPGDTSLPCYMAIKKPR